MEDKVDKYVAAGLKVFSCDASRNHVVMRGFWVLV